MIWVSMDNEMEQILCWQDLLFLSILMRVRFICLNQTSVIPFRNYDQKSLISCAFNWRLFELVIFNKNIYVAMQRQKR